MEFISFEHALHVCMTTPEGSEEQEAALSFCLQHAPPALVEKLNAHLRAGRAEKGCGCGHHHDGCGH